MIKYTAKLKSTKHTKYYYGWNNEMPSIGTIIKLKKVSLKKFKGIDGHGYWAYHIDDLEFEESLQHFYEN